MFHLPVTKYQKWTPQGSRVQPYLSPVRVVSHSSIISGWEITALDKQTGKHSRNYAVILMIQEKTLKPNSVSKLWSLWQHPMYQSRLWVNNLARGSYEMFMPQKANDKKDKWLNPPSSGHISTAISAGFRLQCMCDSVGIPKPLLSSVKVTFCYISNPACVWKASSGWRVPGQRVAVADAGPLQHLSSQTCDPDSRGHLKFVLLIQWDPVCRLFYFGQEKKKRWSITYLHLPVRLS